MEDCVKFYWEGIVKLTMLEKGELIQDITETHGEDVAREFVKAYNELKREDTPWD